MMPTLVVFAGMLPIFAIIDKPMNLFAIPGILVMAIGCLAVCILFNVVSIPLMEKRQLARRPAYKEYKLRTSRLLLMPKEKTYSYEKI